MDGYFNESTIISRVFDYLSTYVGDDYTILPALYAKKLYIDGVESCATQCGVDEFTIEYTSLANYIAFTKPFEKSPVVQLTLESSDAGVRLNATIAIQSIGTDTSGNYNRVTFQINNIPSGSIGQTVKVHWTASIPSD